MLKQKFIHFFILILLLFLAGCREPDRDFKAVAGCMDLRGWDLERNGPVNLAGEWEFYWQQLLEPKDFTRDFSLKETRFVKLPGLWSKDATQDTPHKPYGRVG